MKRLLVLTLMLVTIIGFAAVAVYEGPPPVKEDYWDNLPEAWKFNFTTFGRFGASTRSEAEFQIAGFIFTEESAKRLYKEDWPEPKDWVNGVLNRFSRPINIYVYSYGNSREPFDPAKFTFSQSRNSKEYSVDPNTGILGFESGEVMMGFVDVPSEINAKESFFIHYEYDSEQVYAPGFTWDSPYPEEEEEEKENTQYPSEGDPKATFHSEGNLQKVTKSTESPGGISSSEEIYDISGTVSSSIKVFPAEGGSLSKCSGFVKFEAGKLVDRNFEFSNTNCTYYEGDVELSKGLIDLAISSASSILQISVTKGGAMRTYIYEGEVMVSH